jgi:pimeloyl-[acyl-carrier protein] synthase
MANNYLWQPYAPENLRDPYPMYKKLRNTQPVHYAQTKEYIVTGYDDVKEILKSNAFETGNRMEWVRRGVQYLQSKDEDFSALYHAMNSFVLMLNAPQHMKIRTFISRAWDNREVDTIILRNIEKVLAGISETEFDAVMDFAQPVSLHIISDILGISVKDHRHLHQLGHNMARSIDLYPSMRDLVKINDAAGEFIDFFREQISAKQIHPDEGLLSKLITKNKLEGTGLSEPEIISIAIFLFIAGEETTAGAIGSGIYSLLNHPHELEKLRNDNTLIDTATEEILRHDSIVQLLGRISKTDYTINNTVIPAGSAVTMVVGSANRDETIFDRPDEFKIDRKPNRHLTFGSGPHFCLGDWLGRRELSFSMRAFFEKFRTIQLSEAGPQWNSNLAVRTLKSLKVTTKA